jgi:hypothetical protein
VNRPVWILSSPLLPPPPTLALSLPLPPQALKKEIHRIIEVNLRLYKIKLLQIINDLQLRNNRNSYNNLYYYNNIRKRKDYMINKQTASGFKPKFVGSLWGIKLSEHEKLGYTLVFYKIKGSTFTLKSNSFGSL